MQIKYDFDKVGIPSVKIFSQIQFQPSDSW